MTSDHRTRLDSDVTRPSTTAPGDGAADTTDPTEVASTARPKPGPDAIAAGTVNAVVRVPQPAKPERDTSLDRFEEYDSHRPDGSKVRVRHNLDSGATEIIE